MDLPQKPSYGACLRTGIRLGLKKGWGAFLWMAKIVVPISLLTSILVWTGLIDAADILLKPAMGLMGLPPMAALPIVVGMTTGIYGAVATMAALPLSDAEMTLVAIFVLMCHNLIQEGLVQGSSGMPAWKATLFRLATATLTVAMAALFLEPASSAAPLATAASAALAAPQELFLRWLLDTAWLCLKMFLIIQGLMIVLETAKMLDWIIPITRLFSPILWLMGLKRQVGLLWMTAVIFGLAYGGALIIEESRAKHLTPEDLELLHLSIGINHSLIEDPILFAALGVNVFWLYVPRLVVAVVTVHLIRLMQALRRRES